MRRLHFMRLKLILAKRRYYIKYYINLSFFSLFFLLLLLLQTTKAADAVAALKNSLKPEATVKRDGKMIKMDATLVVPGDCVLLASGSAVPADCRLNEGQIEVDQAQLTGESLPVTMFKGDSCMMGSTVVRGEVEGTVEFTGANTFFGKFTWI